MKHNKCKPGSAASILMGKHASGGEAMPMMEGVGSRRAEPNLMQKFATGGSAMAMEDKLKAVGTYSPSGSEMSKEDRPRRARGGRMKRDMGGDIGTNTGSSIARKPGQGALCTGGEATKRAMGGVAKKRRGYPNT